MLRTTQAGINLIKQFEGCKLKAYRCPAGVWTIGYGLTSKAGIIDVTPGLRITQAQAEEYLTDVVDAFEDRVEQLLGATSPKVTPHQFDAMVSLAYNIGLGAFAKSTVLKMTKARNFDAAAKAFLSWNKVKGRPVAGLTRRRQAEMALFLGDRDAADTLGASLEDTDLPQDIDTPRAPKSMASSSIGNGTIATGGLGLLSAGKEVSDQVAEAAQQGKDLWDTVKDASPWIIVAVLVLALGWYVWNERRKKLVEDGV